MSSAIGRGCNCAFISAMPIGPATAARRTADRHRLLDGHPTSPFQSSTITCLTLPGAKMNPPSTTTSSAITSPPLTSRRVSTGIATSAATAMDAMAKLCKQRFEEFGAAGYASKIKPIPLADMAKRYASGELDPKIA